MAFPERSRETFPWASLEFHAIDSSKYGCRLQFLEKVEVPLPHPLARLRALQLESDQCALTRLGALRARPKPMLLNQIETISSLTKLSPFMKLFEPG